MVIIDEATQAMEAVRIFLHLLDVHLNSFRIQIQVCWIPILKAKKLILAGDPLQLPPTIISLNEKSKKGVVATMPKPKGSSTSSSAKQKSAKKNTSGPSKMMKAEDTKAEPPVSGAEDGEEADSDSEESEDAPSTKPVRGKDSLAKSRTAAKLIPPRTLETTLFDRIEDMYGTGIKRMLTVQYRFVTCTPLAFTYVKLRSRIHRMHERIASFPSTKLYNSSLESHSSVKSHLLRDLPNVSADAQHSDVTEHPVVFFDTAGCEYYERLEGDANRSDEGSRCNENEATVVKMWTEKLVAYFSL